jgi:predicted small integral membrane protein
MKPSCAISTLQELGHDLCVVHQRLPGDHQSEWFGMWQSQQWNGVPSAFRFLITIIAVLIFVALPDQELDGEGRK